MRWTEEETLLNELNMKINMKNTKVFVRIRNNNIRVRIHLKNKTKTMK
jgi:hypothetical protein